MKRFLMLLFGILLTSGLSAEWLTLQLSHGPQFLRGQYDKSCISDHDGFNTKHSTALGAELKVETKEGEWTIFTIRLTDKPS